MLAGYDLACGINAVFLLTDLNGNDQSTTQLGAGYAYGVVFYHSCRTAPGGFAHGGASGLLARLL